MDRLKPGRGNYGGRADRRPTSSRSPATSSPSAKSRHTGEKYWLVRSLGKLASNRKLKRWDRFRQSEFGQWPDKHIRNRIYALAVFGLFAFSTIAGIVQPFLDDKFYGVTSSVRSVLPEPKASLGTYLQYNDKEQQFAYNSGYTGAGSDQLAKTGQGEPRISATFAKEPSKGMSVTDSLNKIDFKLKPKFKLNVGKQDQNQIFYPLVGKTGYLVYTSQVASIKEDIVLEEATEDTLSFEYELDLASGLEARKLDDGKIGIYGTSLPINGQVATGNEKDAALLEKARQASEKDKLLFVIPAPVTVESGREQSVVGTTYELNGNSLKVVASNLKNAQYPLSIDPSVYVQSAAQLMRGNNETNVEFDVATEQFKKGTTTGARIDSWTDTTDGPNGVWDQATAAAGGYVYSAGGRVSRVQPRVVSQKITTQATASTNYVYAMPDVRPAGDLYVAIFADAVNNTSNNVNPPADWTEVADSRAVSVYYKIGANVSGGNEAASYTWTGTSSQYSGVILRIKDFDSASVLTGTPVVTNGTNSTPSYSAVTPGDNGSLQLGIAAFTNVIAPGTNEFATGTSYYGVASGTSNTTASTSSAGFVVQSSEYPVESGTASAAQTFTLVGTASGWGGVNLFIKGNAASQSISNALYWSKFNSTTGSIESSAPGSDGTACSGWCTNSAYNLPVTNSTSTDGAGLIGASMVAYNGYLFLIGGSDGTTPIKGTIYAAKIGANGEPQLWHPSDPNQANWTYWYKVGGSYTPVWYTSAAAYNGRLYVIGGDSNAQVNSGAVNTTSVADILPNGTLGTFSAGPTLPTVARYASVQIYNGYLYLLGGSGNALFLNDEVSGGGTTGKVIYSKIDASTGALGAWKFAAADNSQLGFKTPRVSLGGTMTGIWGGYVYIAGGCTAFNANDRCTASATDVQLASINADGTLGDWNTMIGLRNARFGHSFIAWQDSLYRFGGCGRQSATSDDCWATQKGVQYGNINQDGDASTVSISAATGVGNCQGAEPYDCNLPTAGTGSGQSGQALAATVILNGYIYVIGGCTTNACTTMSSNVSYAAIDSSGKLKNPPFCPGGEYGAWCVDNVNQVNSGNGLGATAATVFNNTIYIVGGQNGSGAVSNIQRNSINPDGSFTGAWSTAQTLASVGAQTVSYSYVYSRANPTSVATNPGNLYIFGGCSSPATGAGCTAGNNYSQNVYKCNITTTGTVSGCSTSGQQAIGTVTGANNPGLGIHAGTVYANYIYLIGGVADGQSDLRTVRYAKFDNNNNVVGVSSSSWTVSPVQMNNGRRRGAAFGYNGYIYSVGGYDASTSQSLDSIEFVKINVSDGSLVSSNNLFKKSAVTINQRWGLGLVVSNSYAYVIGGCKDGASPTCNAGGLDSTVQTFQVYNNDSGAPAGYTSEADQYATQRQGASAAVHNGYMYVAGGCISGSDICTSTTDSVEFAPIDEYGNIGTWASTTDATLPAGRSEGQLEVAGNTLYWIGGQDNSGAASTDIYYGVPNTSTGNVTNWSTVNATGLLPSSQGRSRFSATVWNNRIYVVGGYTGNINSSPTRLNTVVMSPNLSAGGDITSAWTTGGSSFNVARTNHIAVAYANNLYLLGGDNGTNYLSDVQFAKLDSTTGQAGSWGYTTSLPRPITQGDGFAVNGYMYVFGGRSSVNDCTPRTLIAPISANTSIASGNNPTGIGEWYQTNRNYNGGRFGNSAVFANGKAYVIGGGCQGVVMQDDFDANVDASMWKTTTGMNIGTTCQSTSNSNVLYTTSGGASGPSTGEYYTKEINVPTGGTIYFKFFSPSTNTGGCFVREQDAAVIVNPANPDDIVMKYSTTPGGGTGTYTNFTGTGLGWNCACSPMKNFAITIPPGAYSANTTISWWMPTGEANDSYALEDVYIVANGSGSVAPTFSKLEVTSLLSQPQVAHYTRLIDAGKDVFPTKWLMNGIDNSIGARWQMKYRSMNDTTVTDTSKACGGSVMTGFGQLTSFGDVSLGSPENYTVKNGAGTDIKCSRYFFMDVSIDASQTYGYPDDISRGPTLDNLTLFFKSNPGSRLLHGKTFIEGSQQPLDTQPQ